MLCLPLSFRRNTTRMCIYLLRHGETALNAARILQPADTPLNARGEDQAKALARRLRDSESVVGIVSSHLPRALQTAKQIGLSCALDVQLCELLQERNFGDWRGLSYDAMTFDPLVTLDAPPGGDSSRGFAQRVAAAFQFIVAFSASVGGPVAVVTHGMVIRQMLTAHVDGAGWPVMPSHLGNTSVTCITVASPHRVTLMNCTRHLSGDNADNVRSLSGG